MYGDIVCRISKVTARDLVKEILPDEEPTLDRAILLAEELQKNGKMYVNVNYLLDVWMSERKGA